MELVWTRPVKGVTLEKWQTLAIGRQVEVGTVQFRWASRAAARRAWRRHPVRMARASWWWLRAKRRHGRSVANGH